MLNASLFFSNPAISLGQVYCQVLEIFCAEWQTFMALSGLQFACFVPFTILMVITFSVEGAALIGAMGSDDPTRALSDFNNYNPSDGIAENKDYAYTKTDDSLEAPIDFSGMMQQFAIVGEGIFISLLCFSLLAILITSTFHGATIRAAVEVHAGLKPSWLACLKVGWKNMWKITCFGFLLMLAYFTAFMILVVGVLAAIYRTTSSSFPDYFLLLFFVYFVVISIAGAAMIAGPSMVVAEGKSVVEAMKSSWRLCKTDICFIYCSIFCFGILESVAKLTTRAILGSLFSGSDPATWVLTLIVTSFIVSLAIVPLNLM
jgi:hypothetical protein